MKVHYENATTREMGKAFAQNLKMVFGAVWTTTHQSKQQLKQWVSSGLSAQNKTNVASSQKVMVTNFWDASYTSHIDYFPREQIFNKNTITTS